ncbi:MAG: spore photoproduct lyase family protein [Pseudomonadota bacterium]
MNSYTIKKILVEKGSNAYPFGSRILERIPGIPVEEVEPHERGHQKQTWGDKEIIHLLPFKGALLKPCPGTKGYICCGYKILHVGTNCPMDCSYCILQAYFNQPFIKVFVNLEERIECIGQVIDSLPDEIFRIGTGEFTDSLALNALFRWSDILLPFISRRKNAVLELKTKSDRVEGLLLSVLRERVIVSWSLNSPLIVAREEHRTAGLRQRLEAAKRCQSEGFAVGFHFDPLIEYPGWKEGYARTLELLDRYIDPKGIIWMSLGCLRYVPALKGIIRKNHPKTHILDGEFVTGLDGKMRYFKPIRIEMYAFMAESLSRWYKDLGLYLCMESDEVWEQSLGWSPVNSEGLSDYLDKRVLKFFGS